jgi:ADP-heptose:LPS heptosyltransferase
MLTLPMCGLLKKHFPQCEIIFLGRTYTEAVIRCCEHVDHFDNWDLWKDQSPQAQIDALKKWNADTIVHVFPRKEILWVAKRAAIPYRIATGRRLQTISKCNKLVFFTRRKSPLHEAQLNMKLLRPMGITEQVGLSEIATLYGFTKVNALPEKLQELIEHSKLNIILHPKSKGSAVEWGLNSFKELIETLPRDKTKIFVTGTKAEGEFIKREWDMHALQVTDLTGKLSLEELISFIAASDALVAASTGPLHVAAALGKKAIGLYSPKRPMHAGRWAPVGSHAQAITASVHPPKGQALHIGADEVASLLLLN